MERITKRLEGPGINLPLIGYLGLGSSLGPREQHLCDALKRLARRGVELLRISPVYESPHMGLHPGDEIRYPSHLNIAVKIRTTLLPAELLDHIHAVEEAGNRQRQERWGPRTIDIDILSLDGVVVNTPTLTLPHEGIAARDFVALPLLDLDPEFQFPDGRRLNDHLGFARETAAAKVRNDITLSDCMRMNEARQSDAIQDQ